jgi:hypothetical protein
MNRLISGDMDPSAWSTSARRFNSVLEGKPCKCVDTQEVSTEEDEKDDEDAAAMDEEGEGPTREDGLEHAAIVEDEEDGDEAEGPVGEMGGEPTKNFIPQWALPTPPARSREKPAVFSTRVTRSQHFVSGGGGGGSNNGGGEGEVLGGGEGSGDAPSTSL